MTIRVRSVTDPRAVQALAQPMRVQVLEALREPASAAGVARRLGEPRQKVNYHLKELVRVGLARHSGERRRGNFVEQLYQAVARRFVISNAITWDAERLQATLRDQVSLAHLADLGERLQQDAAGLLDRAAYEAVEIPSATIEAEIRLGDAASRARFLEEYLAAIGPLLKKYGVADEAGTGGDVYRLAVAVYPDSAADADFDPDSDPKENDHVDPGQ